MRRRRSRDPPRPHPHRGCKHVDLDVGEDVRFRGFTRLIVVAGDDGNNATAGPGETIDLVGLDMTGANPLTDVILDGDNASNTDLDNDVIRVRTLPATVTATLLGGAGGDSFVLDSDPTNVAAVGGTDDTVDNILGPLSSPKRSRPAGTAIPAGLPEEAGAGDSLLVEDRDDTTADTVRLTSTLITHAATAGAQGITGYAGAGEEITYGVTDLIETITINSSTGGDTFNVESTAPGAVTR